MGYAFNPFTGNFDNTGSGGIAIGDAITSASADRLLYTDDSGNLANTHWGTDNTSYFAGAVTGAYIGTAGFTAPRLEMLNLSGLGQPNALAFTVNNASGALYFTDVNTLTTYLGFNFDLSTATNRNFTVGLASGISSSPEFKVLTTKVELNVPIDLNTHKITELDTPTAGGDAVNKTYADGLVSDTAYGSGWDGVTTIAPSKNAVYDKINSLSIPTVSGGDGLLQLSNGAGALTSDTDLYWLSAYNVLRATNGGMQVSPGHSTYGFGDTDGNGKVTFDGNAVRLYGYSAIELADGSGKFSDISRSRISHGTQSINTTPIGGGNMDYGLQFGEYVTAYAGKGIGAGYVPRVDASANNDMLIGSYFTGNLIHGSYTGVTKYNAYFVSLTADTVGVRFQAASSQTANVFEIANSSMAVQLAIAANGRDFILDTTTGSKIGTATTQKLGFYNSTPIVQPSSTGEATGFTAGSGTAVNDVSTFTGNVGSTAYRINDIVKHLKNLGLIAA